MTQTSNGSKIEKSTGRLWRWLGLIFVLSFGALGYHHETHPA